MRAIFLTFEAVLTVFWFWCAFWTFSFFSRKTSVYIERPDYGTVIGGLLFLAFGVGTAAMLGHEFLLMWRRHAAARVATLAISGGATTALPAPTTATPTQTEE